MTTRYHYIVVTIDGDRYFISKDMSYTDNFADVLRFSNRADALEFIQHQNLQSECAQIIELVEPVK